MDEHADDQDNIHSSPTRQELSAGTEPASAIVRVGTPEWEALTERRAALIYKKNREGLNAEESAELDRLQQVSREAIAAFATPSPIFDKKLAMLEQLAREGGGPKH